MLWLAIQLRFAFSFNHITKPVEFMKSRNTLIAVVLVTIILTAFLISYFRVYLPAKVINPPNESEVEMTLVEQGSTYKLYQGGLWRVNFSLGKWEFVEQIYDPAYYAKNYVEHEGLFYRKPDKGKIIPVKRQLVDDFENTETFRDLFDLNRWTECELLSPKAPTVKDNVKLRKQLLKGETNFLDNRIEPTAKQVHSGKESLKFFSVPPTPEMICSKSSLTSEMLHFVKGDDVWISAWFYVPKGSGMPFSLIDLETTWMKQHPGIRIVILDGKYACFQLKWNKRYYQQSKGLEVAFPFDQWVHLKAHIKLSEKEDGIIELWQDGAKIINSNGQTLVLANMIYNSFEIGITACVNRTSSAIMYMDDVSISDQPLISVIAK